MFSLERSFTVNYIICFALNNVLFVHHSIEKVLYDIRLALYINVLRCKRSLRTDEWCVVVITLSEKSNWCCVQNLCCLSPRRKTMTLIFIRHRFWKNVEIWSKTIMSKSHSNGELEVEAACASAPRPPGGTPTSGPSLARPSPCRQWPWPNAIRLMDRWSGGVSRGKRPCFKNAQNEKLNETIENKKT